MAFSVGWFPITFSTDCRFKLQHKRKKNKKAAEGEGRLFFFPLPIYLHCLRAQATFLSSPDVS